MAVGGSGIRVINNQNEYKGYDGAIDKDLSSSLWSVQSVRLNLL
ncbi:hypothetical protein [Acidiplasma sp.]